MIDPSQVQKTLISDAAQEARGHKLPRSMAAKWRKYLYQMMENIADVHQVVIAVCTCPGNTRRGLMTGSDQSAAGVR